MQLNILVTGAGSLEVTKGSTQTILTPTKHNVMETEKIMTSTNKGKGLSITIKHNMK